MPIDDTQTGGSTPAAGEASMPRLRDAFARRATLGEACGGLRTVSGGSR